MPFASAGFRARGFARARARARRRRTRALARLDAALQRGHQVDDRLGLLRPLRRHDLVPCDLLVDRRQHGLPVAILVALGAEALARELLDQLLGECELAGAELHLVAELDVLEARHLVGVVHAVQHEAASERSDQNELLAAARPMAAHRHAPHREHRLVQQPVRLRAALVGPEQLRLLEVDRIHLVDRHELLDLDRLVAPGLERLQLLVGQDHVLIPRILVAAHRGAALDRLAALGAHVLLLEAGAVGRVQHVEVHALRAGRRIHLDRDRDETEGDRPGGRRASRHGGTCTGEGRVAGDRKPLILP